MNDFVDNQPSPWWKSLMLLLFYTVSLSFAVQLAALIIGSLSGANLDFINGADNSATGNNRFFMYAILASGTFGTFYLPAFMLQKKEPMTDYFPAEKSPIIFFLLAIGLLFAFGPLMEKVGEWNANMNFPNSLKSIETWMRVQEESSSELIKKVVMVDHLGLLLVNIIVMAVFPAVAEEYYFRGALMGIFGRLFKNIHVTIWVTAIIFSAIHIQFLGFFPRMILGAFFGYMLVWTNNIWVPIVGHFVNNAAVTVLAYYYTTQGKSFEDLQAYDSYSIFVYLGSLILTIAIAIVFYKKSKEYSTHDERLD